MTQTSYLPTEADLVSYKFADLVVAYDFSEAAESALKYAAWLAKRFGSFIHLVGVQSPADHAGSIDGSLLGMKMAQNNLKFGLKGVEQGLQAVGIRCDSIWKIGNVADSIEGVVLENPPDLLLFGAFGYGPLDRRRLGSTAEHLLRTCRCPSFVIGPQAVLRGREAPPLERILCAISSLESSDNACCLAANVASRLGARLELLHVVDMDQTDDRRMSNTRQGEEWIRDLRKRPIDAQYTIKHGRPDSLIATHAADSKASFIFFGLHRSGSRMVDCPDGVVSATIREAHCPVMTFPSALPR
jgi:nucleotide-binding universal stress UspA family protein